MLTVQFFAFYFILIFVCGWNLYCGELSNGIRNGFKHENNHIIYSLITYITKVYIPDFPVPHNIFNKSYVLIILIKIINLSLVAYIIG